MKKSLISIAALGLLSIPALASSTTVQTGKVIDSALSAELDRIGGLLSQRKLVADDFVDVRPMVNSWVKKIDTYDPSGISEHAVVSEQLDLLQSIAVGGIPIMIIDDWQDLRQSMIHVGLVSRIRVYRDTVLLNKPASLQPIIDAITERQQNALPKDPRTAPDAASAKQIANDLAKRVMNKTAQKDDFNFLIEVAHGQRMLQFVRITLARRQATGGVSAVEFKHVRNLISARNVAELQLYRDAGTEKKRLDSATSQVQAAAMQAGATAAPYRWLAAVSVDLNLRRSMTYLQRKSVAETQTKANFNRLRDLLAIRAQGPIGRTNMGRELTKLITAEVGKLELIASSRALTKDDFTSMQRLRDALMTSTAEATFEK
jgi:hypothetical protein